MHKTLNERSMVGIRVIHNTQEDDMTKDMRQVQDNPSIMCIGCSENRVALNTMEREIVHHVWGNQVKRDKQWDMAYAYVK